MWGIFQNVEDFGKDDVPCKRDWEQEKRNNSFQTIALWE